MTNATGRTRCVAMGWVALGLWLLTIGPAEAQEPPTVSRVQVIGARRWPESAVLNMLSTRVGQPFQPDRVLEDTRKLDLTQRYVVGVTASHQITNDGVEVTFRVVERATIKEIIYHGAKHLSKDELESLTGLRKNMPMSVALNQRAAAAIERAYHQKGRLFAKVYLEEGGKDDDLRVVFRITEGPVVRIRDIRFEGAQFVSSARLKTQIDSGATFAGFGGVYNPMMLEHDVTKLREYYRAFGFFDAKIKPEIKWNPGFETVDVVFVVDEGQRFLVRDVTVAGTKQIDSDILLAHNTVKAGAPYNAREMQTGLVRMQNEYGRAGYINTRIQPEFKYDETPGEVTLVYQVQEGQPARVGEIKIIGNTVTRDNVIRRQLGIYPNQLLSTPDLRASERNLGRLGIFKTDPGTGQGPTVTILDPDSPSEYKDILVQVEEDRTGSLMFAAGVNSDAGVTGSVILNERNFDITRIPTSWEDIWSNRAFRGAGQEFRIEAMPGNELQRYSVSWREPFLFDTPYSFGVSGYYYTRRFNEYDERRTGGRLQVGRRFSPLWSANFSFRAEDVEVRRVQFFAPETFQVAKGHNTLLNPRVALTRDTRDSFLRPTEGNYFEIAYEHGFGSFTYPMVTLEDSQYWTVYERPDGSGRHVVLLRGLAGWAGDDTPVFEKFYAGGFRSLRGFEFRGAGPDIRGFKVGGTFMAVGTLEYQIPLLANDNVYAVVFTDFGTVDNDVTLKNIRCSVGAGLRLTVPMFGPSPLALDWAIPVAKEPTDNRQIFAFFITASRF